MIPFNVNLALDFKVNVAFASIVKEDSTSSSLVEDAGIFTLFALVGTPFGLQLPDVDHNDETAPVQV